MREVKEVYHSQAERDQALLLLSAYQTESTRILNESCPIEHVIQQRYQKGDITLEQYKEERKPFWEKYKTDDKLMYSEYVKGASDLGYYLEAE